MCISVSCGSLSFVATCPMSRTLLFHIFCTVFDCFKQEGIYGPCYFILARSEIHLKQPLRCGQMNILSLLRISVSLDKEWEMVAMDCLRLILGYAL